MLLVELGPQEIDLGGETGTGSDGDGSDSNVRDGGGDGAVESGAGARGSGGEDGGEGGGDGDSGGNSVKHAAVFPGIRETVESVEEWRGLVG